MIIILLQYFLHLPLQVMVPTLPNPFRGIMILEVSLNGYLHSLLRHVPTYYCTPPPCSECLFLIYVNTYLEVMYM